MRKSSVLLMALICSACYSYATIPLSTLTKGNDVKLDLTSDGTARLASQVGPKVTSIRGAVVSRDSSTLTIAVNQVDRGDEGFNLMHGATVSVPADAVATAQMKKMSATRSVLLGGALATGSLLVMNGLTNESTHKDVSKPPVQTQ